MAVIIHQSGCTVIELGDSYDSLDLDALNDAGSVLLTRATDVTPPQLVVDMSATTFIGSTFIELLVRTWKRLSSRHGTMAVCGLQPFCAEILRVTRLDTLWRCYATREDALRALTGDSSAAATDAHAIPASQ